MKRLETRNVMTAKGSVEIQVWVKNVEAGTTEAILEFYTVEGELQFKDDSYGVSTIIASEAKDKAYTYISKANYNMLLKDGHILVSPKGFEGRRFIKVVFDTYSKKPAVAEFDAMMKAQRTHTKAPAKKVTNPVEDEEIPF